MMNVYVLGLLGATLAWGLGFIIVKQGVELVGIWPFFYARFWIGALILILCFRQRIMKFERQRLIGASVLAGILFIHLWLQTKGLHTITASRAGFITSFYVPLVPLLSWIIFRRKVLPRQWFLVFLASLGLGILSLPEGTASLSISDIKPGDIWVTLAALAAAFHIVATEWFARHEPDPVSLGFWQFVFAALLFTLGVSYQSYAEEIPAQSFQFWNWPQRALICMLIAASLGTAFAFVMQIICQKRVESVKASIIFALEAPFAMLFGVGIGGDKLSNNEILGALLLFTASIIPDKPLKKRSKG